MNIQYSYEIKKDEYEEIFRTHLKYKFHLRRSMYMSCALYLFGLVMQYGIGMDFAFINMFVLVVFIFSILMNLLADFYLPKKAFLNLVSVKQHHGDVKISSTDICITHDKLETKFEWDKFSSFTENDFSFLLYKKDTLYLIPKQFDLEKIDEVRNLLKEKIGH